MNRIGKSLSAMVLVLLVLFACVPLLWTVLSAFKSLPDIVTPTPRFLFKPTLDNFAYVFSRDSIRDGLINSVIVTGCTVLVGAVLGVPAAYVIARYPLKHGHSIRFFILSLRFLPPVAVALPFVGIATAAGIYDTRFALVIAYLLLALGIIIWLSIPAFQQVPREIEEAARIDGWRPYAIFFKVVLPVAAPGLFGAAIFSFVLIWNEFFMALMLTSSSAKTLPVVASEFTQMGLNVPWGILNASVVILSFPPLMFLGVLSRFLNKLLKTSSTRKVA